MRRFFLIVLSAALAACSGGSSNPQPPPGGSNLSGFAIGQVEINAITFQVWIAQTDAQRQQGFMFATKEQTAPLMDGTERGMLFVFSNPTFLSFFMRNTFIPLDLAYIRADGTIAEIHALQPLDETPVVASEPVQYALEVNAGVLAAMGIGVGDTVILPP